MTDLDPIVWPSAAQTTPWLTTLRGALPLAAVQLDVLLRLLATVKPNVDFALDLGCGDGLLSHVLRTQYPHAELTLVDQLAPALLTAESKLGNIRPAPHFAEADYGAAGWQAALQNRSPFDVIVAGYALHRLPDTRKQALFTELFHLLDPGGWLFVLDHVASPSGLLERAWDALVIDARFAWFQAQGSEKLRHDVDWDWHNRNDKDRDMLAPLPAQLDWLTDSGFVQVGSHFQVMQTALFGGQRPA